MIVSKEHLERYLKETAHGRSGNTTPDVSNSYICMQSKVAGVLGKSFRKNSACGDLKRCRRFALPQILMWAFTAALGHKSTPFKFHSHGTGKVQLRLGMEANRKAVATRTLHPSELESVAATENGSNTQTKDCSVTESVGRMLSNQSPDNNSGHHVCTHPGLVPRREKFKTTHSRRFHLSGKVKGSLGTSSAAALSS